MHVHLLQNYMTAEPEFMCCCFAITFIAASTNVYKRKRGYMLLFNRVEAIGVL